jgi:hypothetical protein
VESSRGETRASPHDRVAERKDPRSGACNCRRRPLNVSSLLCNALRASAGFGFEHLGDCHPAAASILDRGCIRSLTSFGSLRNCGRARSRQQCNQAQFVARSTKAKGAPRRDERKSTFPRRANPSRPPRSVSTIHSGSHRHFSLFKVSLWAHSEPQ